MISVEGLRKRYGEFTAVAGSDFEVASGEVFGVVGPNGAGKTTTLNVLAGLLEPTAGTATVAGYDVGDPAMRSVIGFLPEGSPLYEDMTARSYLRFFADLYDVPRKSADERIEATLDRLGLQRRSRRLGEMSKGMKRKVVVARSLINDPEVLIYDEPAGGLDPLATDRILEFVRELSNAGRTIVFSAHNLHHVADVCDRVIVMVGGEIVARGTVAEIRATNGSTTYHVYTTVPVEGATGNGDRYESVVDDVSAVERVRTEAEDAGGEVVDIRTREPSFEEAFLDLVDRSTGIES